MLTKTGSCALALWAVAEKECLSHCLASCISVNFFLQSLFHVVLRCHNPGWRLGMGEFACLSLRVRLFAVESVLGLLLTNWLLCLDSDRGAVPHHRRAE